MANCKFVAGDTIDERGAAGNGYTRCFRGRLAALRAAGLLPSDVAVNESARRRVDWTGGGGRKFAIVPYGDYGWELRIYPTLAEKRARRIRWDNEKRSMASIGIVASVAKPRPALRLVWSRPAASERF